MFHLYIKECSHCGLKYFEAIIQNPFEYLGSGDRWANHYRKHRTSSSDIDKRKRGINTPHGEFRIISEASVVLKIDPEKIRTLVKSSRESHSEWYRLELEKGICHS